MVVMFLKRCTRWGYPGRATLTAWVREAVPETSKAVTGRTDVRDIQTR
ncbi:hypothetical protein QBD00_002542 [Ochrobactrum sp. AN78]|nr:hypothetical protein [Ochrobactrum sp. AN78]